MALLRPGTLHGAALKAAEKGPRMSKIGTLIRIVVALSLLLAAPAQAQDVRFHDRAGRVTPALSASLIGRLGQALSD